MTLTLASVFTDNLVLQQGVPAPVWGSAAPGAGIKVGFAGQEKKTRAGADGRWMVRLDPLAACAEPGTLVVSAQGQGSEAEVRRLGNVLVGEVWVCSGQSNMQWQLAQARDAAAEVAAAVFPAIRMLTVPNVAAEMPAEDIGGAVWKVCSPETATAFSAVGYFFGRELHRRLNVPVGLIDSSWGGTVAEAWTSREGLLAEPAAREIVEDYERRLPELSKWRHTWKDAVAALEERIRDTGDTGKPRGWADLPEPAGEWKDMEIPGAWQNRGLNFSGILWFRKLVEIPRAWLGRDLSLTIGATDKSDITYFNGVEVGSVTMRQRGDAWCFQRTYTVPASLPREGRNIIAVRVHSDRYHGGMTGPAAIMQLACPSRPDSEPIPLAGTWRYAIEANYGLVEFPPEPPGPGNPNTPSALFNGMIAPLLPFAARGAIWYQGESNVGRARQYQALFPALIRDWRRAWANEDFAFYFVQLANYLERKKAPAESLWAELREAQTAALRLPHTGMAVAIDIGKAHDIHPTNKQDVGLRLAFNTLNQTYGMKTIVPCGPIFRTMRREGRALRLFFDHACGGLVCRGPVLRGFALAGAEGRHVWAEGRIEGDTVVLAGPDAAAASAVRYGWADNPDCNLYNAAGLPASPFRADCA